MVIAVLSHGSYQKVSQEATHKSLLSFGTGGRLLCSSRGFGSWTICCGILLVSCWRALCFVVVMERVWHFTSHYPFQGLDFLSGLNTVAVFGVDPDRMCILALIPPRNSILKIYSGFLHPAKRLARRDQVPTNNCPGISWHCLQDQHQARAFKDPVHMYKGYFCFSTCL